MKEFIVKTIIAIFLLSAIPIPAQELGETAIVLFEHKNISTKSVEYCASFSSSGTEVYFTRSQGKWGTGDLKNAIYHSIKTEGQWSSPILAPFSGEFDDSDPHLSADGNTLYFISKRPSDGIPISADIWAVEKNRMGKWEAPVRLDAPLNSEAGEYSPCTDDFGNLYFASDRSNGFGQGDLYMAKKTNKEFKDPINLGNTVNTDKGEWNLAINGKGDLLIFEASERKENISSYGDLYISFKMDGRWTIPQNIAELNTPGSDLYPHLVNHGSTLFFTSSDSLKSMDTNIYFTYFTPIYEKYRAQAVFSK